MNLTFSNWMGSYVFLCSSFSSGLSWIVVFSFELDLLIFDPKPFSFSTTALQGRFQHLYFTLEEMEAHSRPPVQQIASRKSLSRSAHCPALSFLWPQNASRFWIFSSVNVWTWVQCSLSSLQVLRFSSHAFKLLMEMRLGAGPNGSELCWETCCETWQKWRVQTGRSPLINAQLSQFGGPWFPGCVLLFGMDYIGSGWGTKPGLGVSGCTVGLKDG